jgi:GNAT superfamily N-acetyltransferase
MCPGGSDISIYVQSHGALIVDPSARKMLSIRPIAESEYELAAQVALSTFGDSVAASMDPQGVQTFEAFAKADAILLRDAAGGLTYVAMECQRMVGVLHVRDGNHIALFFVLPTCQRAGIGGALMRTVDQVRNLLTVNSSVNAVLAYEKLGFHADGPEQIVDGIRFVPMKRNSY